MEMTVLYYCPENELDIVLRFRGKRVSNSEIIEGIWAMVSDMNGDFAWLMLDTGEKVMLYRDSLEGKNESGEWVKCIV